MVTWPGKKPFLVTLLFLVYVLMSYNASIFVLGALIGSFLILIISRATWPRSWKERLGLGFKIREITAATLLVFPLIFLLNWSIQTIASSQNILYQSPFTLHGIFSPLYLHTLGQTLNEELILGALLLFTLSRTFKKFHPFFIAVWVAAGFAVLHYIFYAWIVLPDNSGSLTLSTLFVLFGIGLLRNTLILKTRHIAFAWSLHLSINLVGLWGLYTSTSGGELSEPEIFNLILGSPRMVIPATFALLVCAILLSDHIRLI